MLISLKYILKFLSTSLNEIIHTDSKFDYYIIPNVQHTKIYKLPKTQIL